MQTSSCATASGYDHLSPEVRDVLERTSQALQHLASQRGGDWAKRLTQSKTLNQQLARAEQIHRVAHVGSWPQIVELPVAGKCNLRCTMCSLSHGAPTYPHWTLDEVKRFEPYFQFSVAVNPTGVGEPLLNRDFMSMMEYFSNFGLNIGFYTNATMLSPDKVDQLIRAQVRSINISLDGATAPTFEAIRHHAKFDQVVGNTRYLIQRRNQLGSTLPRLQIAMVLMQENIHEFPELIDLAHELGADSVYAAFVSSKNPEDLPQRHPERTNAILAEARKRAGVKQLKIWAPNDVPALSAEQAQAQDSKPAESLACLRCNYPWTQFMVWNDGAVSPCCHIRDEAHGEPFGNIKDADPAKLWNSPGFVRLRESFREGKPPKACLQCKLMQSSQT